jgi:hypothetical protein
MSFSPSSIVFQVQTTDSNIGEVFCILASCAKYFANMAAVQKRYKMTGTKYPIIRFYIIFGIKRLENQKDSPRESARMLELA